MVSLVAVWARVSPQQKQEVLLALNSDPGTNGFTMMVGDGTNDVGALKHAHIGVSLLTSVVPFPASQTAHARPEFDDDVKAPMVRLGDASIASPFTYKGDSVRCSLQVLRCGRATLATTLMMYKIMGLNSIMSALAMSALTLDGVKLGDGQAAFESLFTSLCFFLVCRSAPAKKLAKQQPTSSIFDWSAMLSLVLQLGVHMSIMLYGWSLAVGFRPKDYKRDLDGDFEPNVTNTVVFELMATMHASSFFANYEGHPFMQPITSNKALLYGLVGFLGIILTCATEILPDLNEMLSLVQCPTPGLRAQVLSLVLADIVLSISLTRALNFVAIRMRGRAAERRARAMGLGLALDGGGIVEDDADG